jgi:4-amino-4-deoxy-L-arabinose transferase-like glycosyltransferase
VHGIANVTARARGLAAAVPKPLAWLLIVVATFGLAWAMIVPPWQSPDAFTHYAYTESLATRLALPGRSGYNELSAGARAGEAAVGAHQLQWSSPEAKPNWDPSVADRSRAGSSRLSRSDGAGPTPSSANPPLYYVYATVPYLATFGGDALDRLSAIQLWGVALLLATVSAAWLLAGEVFGRRRLLQLLTAAVAGLQPMTAFMSTSVNPDALLITLWTLALWLGARLIHRGANRREITALCGLTAAAILTKESSYALVPPVALALVLGWRRRADTELERPANVVGRAILLSALPVMAWIVIVRALNRPALTIAPPTASVSRAPGAFVSHFLDYLWQFYLPRLPGQAPFHVPTLAALPWPRVMPGGPLWNLWIREGWGVFGWVDVYMTSWVYIALASVTAVVVVLALAIIARFRDRLRWSLLAYFGLAVGSLLAVVHVIEFATLRSGQGPFIQGRYLLPVISLFGLAVALVVSRIPARSRGPVSAVLIVGLLSLQVLALATVAKAYYT